MINFLCVKFCSTLKLILDPPLFSIHSKPRLPILLVVRKTSLWRAREAIMRKAVENTFIFLLISKFVKHFVMLKVEHSYILK